MGKHARDDIDQGSDSSPKKAAKSTSACEYCNKEFTTRGIPLHQKKCAKKLANDKAAAKKTRSYKFCILNEVIYEEILSFLGNQTLTKMQMITGDRYQQCEPMLARYCCKCENDNPVIRGGCCRHCKHFNRYSYIDDAKDKYGMTEKDFLNAVGREHRGIFNWGMRNLKAYRRSHCSWSTLEQYMIETCGSKMEWLRTLVKRDVIKKKALATRTQNEKRSAFLRALDPWFDSYVRSIRFKETGEEELKQCSRRFVALKAKLKERGLCLQPDSAPCNVFITTGKGSVEGVVETVVGSTT
ncbi:hypothetical protein JG688_00005707 [Phytophthora aleatoria]|uniref:Uncharacterized protein n=1 Tax=Phytophthora aleatoria TaxID=2496075 RepID=A0A8J5IPE8_9STRA|nr:hypothetical protein JG688_00005707 [Phytophthora aleatoria]